MALTHTDAIGSTHLDSLGVFLLFSRLDYILDIFHEKETFQCTWKIYSRIKIKMFYLGMKLDIYLKTPFRSSDFGSACGAVKNGPCDLRAEKG